MATDRRTEADLRQILSEAHAMCRRATDAGAVRSDQITMDTSTPPAFHHVLQSKLRAWLQRAEAAVRAAKARAAFTADAANAELLNQARHLIDAANVAVMVGSKNPHVWVSFYSAVDQTSSQRAAPRH